MPALKIGQHLLRRISTTGEITSREMLDIDREIRDQRKKEYEQKKIRAKESAADLKQREKDEATSKKYGMQGRLYDLAGKPLDWVERQFETFGDDKFQFSDIATLLAAAYILSPSFRTQSNQVLGISTPEKEKEEERRREPNWEDSYTRAELEAIWAQTRY